MDRLNVGFRWSKGDQGKRWGVLLRMQEVEEEEQGEVSRKDGPGEVLSEAFGMLKGRGMPEERALLAVWNSERRRA